MNNYFMKSDLKDGMIVELCDNTRGILLGSRILFNDSWLYLNSLDKYLVCTEYPRLSVRKIYRSREAGGISELFDDRHLELISELEECITVAEMKDRLEGIIGKKYRIIN
mgnify:FL=1